MEEKEETAELDAEASIDAPLAPGEDPLRRGYYRRDYVRPSQAILDRADAMLDHTILPRDAIIERLQKPAGKRVNATYARFSTKCKRIAKYRNGDAPQRLIRQMDEALGGRPSIDDLICSDDIWGFAGYIKRIGLSALLTVKRIYTRIEGNRDTREWFDRVQNGEKLSSRDYSERTVYYIVNPCALSDVMTQVVDLSVRADAAGLDPRRLAAKNFVYIFGWTIMDLPALTGYRNYERMYLRYYKGTRYHARGPNFIFLRKTGTYGPDGEEKLRQSFKADPLEKQKSRRPTRPLLLLERPRAAVDLSGG